MLARNLPPLTKQYLYELAVLGLAAGPSEPLLHENPPGKTGTSRKYGWTRALPPGGGGAYPHMPPPGALRLVRFDGIGGRREWWVAKHPGADAGAFVWEPIIFPACIPCGGTSTVQCADCAGRGSVRPGQLGSTRCNRCGAQGFRNCDICTPAGVPHRPVVVDGSSIDPTWARWL